MLASQFVADDGRPQQADDKYRDVHTHCPSVVFLRERLQSDYCVIIIVNLDITRLKPRRLMRCVCVKWKFLSVGGNC